MTTTNDTITLTGRTGTAPVVKQLENNRIIARFALASSVEIMNKSGEKVHATKWHQVVAWGRCAHLVQQKVKKGKKISIIGKNTSRPYTDKEGKLREKPEIVLYNLQVHEPQIA